MQISAIFGIFTEEFDETPTLMEAWDEYSIDENLEGWEEAIKKARANAREIRIINWDIPVNEVLKTFRPTQIEIKK
jgi:hypothetical protein